MKRMPLVLVLTAIVALWIGWAAYQKTTLETPEYTVIAQHAGYEVREYAPYILAQARHPGPLRESITAGFRSVAGYIFGGNTSENGVPQKIAMTAPVLHTRRPEGQKRGTTAFILPKKWTKKTLPKPDETGVKLREMPARTVAAMRFSGGWNDGSMTAKTQALREALAADGYTPTGPAQYAFYDPPTTPFFMKRNEVLQPIERKKESNKSEQNERLATFAGGCFWCVETAFETLDGVTSAVSGYAGGTAENAYYERVTSGTTKHREAVQVRWDDSTSYTKLVQYFLQQIDPTDGGGQFADRGFSYTTAIFHHNDEQRKAALGAVKSLSESNKFDQEIRVKVLPFKTFFPAEEEHQNFAKKQREYYDQYATGSGRKPFLDEQWGDETPE